MYEETKENNIVVPRLKYILHAEGMVDMATAQYQYYLKDHLGNTRIVVSQNGVELQQSAYYPFGMSFMQTNGGSDNKYLYNGKELQDDLLGNTQLDWYDYGARMYDAAIGRWHVVDPLAEEYYKLSHYVYCGNNPISFIDPDGRSMEVFASSFITPDGTLIEHRDDGDPRVYLVKDPDAWRKNGSKKEDAEHVGYEYPGVDYASRVGQKPFYYLSKSPSFPGWLNDGPIEEDYTLESLFFPVFGWLKYVNFGGKVAFKLTTKISKQLAKRGWSDDLISKVINKPYTTRVATNKATGNKATAFFAKDGSYVVKDDVTREIIQVSNKADINWVPDPTIVNPYIPKK